MDPGIAIAELLVQAGKKPEDKTVEPVKIIPLQEVVNKFKPNLISATQQLVMVGSRTLRVGDPVQIEHEGALFKLRIVKITATEVEFINEENQEKASAREDEFDPSSLKWDDRDFRKKMKEKETPLFIK